MATKTTKANLLTFKGVEKAKLAPGKAEDWLNDGDGLRLRVLPSGKTWYFVYQVKRDASATKIRIGTFPTISLVAAREAAAKFRAMRAAGHDPKVEIAAREQALQDQHHAAGHAERHSLTMDELFVEYDAKHGVTLEKHHRDVMKSRWKCHISPTIGAISVKLATEHPVMSYYNETVTAGKHATPRAALGLLVRVMKWAAKERYADDDHSLLSMQIPDKPRTVRQDQLPENFSAKEFLAKHGKDAIGQDSEDERAGRALQFSELAILLHDILPRSHQAESGKRMIRLMLATGIRAGETTRVRWDWISLEDRLLIIPAGSMKKRRMHHVYLSEYAMMQLDAMSRLRTNEFVFPAPIKPNASILRSNVGTDIVTRQFYRTDDECESDYEARLARRISCKRATREFNLYNLPGGRWTLYDMRRTVATRLEELGFDNAIVGRVLAHAPREKTSTNLYTRFSHWEMRRKALDALGTALQSCDAGELPKIVTKNVFPIRRLA